MPTLLVLLRRRIALPFQCIDMHHNRLFAVLHLLERINQRRCVISLIYINIIQTKCLEQIALCLSVCFAQQL